MGNWLGHGNDAETVRLPPVSREVAREIRNHVRMTGDESFNTFMRRLLIAYEDANREEKYERELRLDFDNLSEYQKTLRCEGKESPDIDAQLEMLAFTYPELVPKKMEGENEGRARKRKNHPRA